jgi:hypothetical protein
MLPEIEAVLKIHEEDDVKLSDIARGIGISESGLNRIINNPERKPWRRTMHKIRVYLESRKPKPIAKPRKPRRVRADEATV